MSTHNICLCGKLEKITPELSSSTPPLVIYCLPDSKCKELRTINQLLADYIEAETLLTIFDDTFST